MGDQQLTMLPGLFPGLQGFRPDMTTSLPSGRSPITYLTNIPGSRTEAERYKITSEGGASKTQESVNVNYVLHRWDNHDYAREIFKGQPLFVLRLKGNPIVMNIRQVNRFLAEGDATALALWKDRTTIVNDGILTAEQYDLLVSSPTEAWEDFDWFNVMLRERQKRKYHCIRYLYEAGMRDRLAFCGYSRNPPDDLDIIQISVAVYGTVEYVENCWSNKAHNGYKIGFVYRRIFDHMANGYTHFAFDPRPWLRGTDPSIQSASYEDVTGTITNGKIFQIDTIDEYVIAHTIEQDVVDESVGLKPTIRDRFFLSGEPGCLRIALHPRAEFPIPWYH